MSCIAVFTETTGFLPTCLARMETQHCWVLAAYWLDLGGYSIRGSIECSVETSTLLQSLVQFTDAHRKLSEFTAMLHLFYSYHQPVIIILFHMLFSELFSVQVMSAVIFVSLSVMLLDHNLHFPKLLEVECYCFWKQAEQN